MSQLAESLKKCKIEGNTLFLPPISDGPLPGYHEFRKTLLKAGAKYKRNTFVFSTDAQSVIDRLIAGEAINIKKDFQFFETPPKLANYLVELAGLKADDKILEPSAGTGNIVKAIKRVIGLEKLIYVYELIPENQGALKKIIECKFVGDDFLECKTKYDKIIANPPFSKNQDIDHIYKMYNSLKKGGRLVSVASIHWKESKNKKEAAFRDWLTEVNATIEDIPRGSFKESGTMVPACIIVINK